MSSEIAYLSASALVRSFENGELSPVEAAHAALRQIELHNPALNAFSLTAEGTALELAAESEKRWRAGKQKGLLDGIPISVKDTLMVSGYPFRRGSRATSPAAVAESAPVVDRLMEAGAVLLGITTTPEFGAGPVTISPLTGITRNPWDHAKGSGGSSGGAAAAVAAGMGTAALASDAGGSVRIPSAFCGVVGFKATGGRIPAYPPNVAGTLSAPGPIARTVEDVALVLDAAMQPDTRDAEAVIIPGERFAIELPKGHEKKLRIAFTTSLNYAPLVDPEVEEAVRRAAAHFELMGAHVEEAHPAIQSPQPFFLTLYRAGFAYSLRNLTPEQTALLSPQVLDVVAQGRHVTLVDYMEAQDMRRSFARAMELFFAKYDLLLTPTVAVTAFGADQQVPRAYEHFNDIRSWTPFAYPFNMTQQPALSIPCGVSRKGMPIGLQIVGPRFADLRVLQAGCRYEKTRSPLPQWPCA